MLLDACEAAHARGARVAAYGCLIARHEAELRAALPEVDLFSAFDVGPVLELLARLAGRGAGEGSGGGAGAQRPRRRPTHAYVKISDGCDRRCSFCAIPLIKGTYETVAPAEILARRGATPSRRAPASSCSSGRTRAAGGWPGYGGLDRLLGDLRALGAVWLRLLYLQPDGLSAAVLEALAAYSVPYLDLPLQHASRRGARRHGPVRRRRRVPRPARRACGRRCRRSALRSTFIAGFPGETDDDVEELDRVHRRRPPGRRRRLRLRPAGGHARGHAARSGAGRPRPRAGGPGGRRHRARRRAATGAPSWVARSTCWSNGAVAARRPS